MKRLRSQIVSRVLVLGILVTMLPMPAFAAEDSELPIEAKSLVLAESLQQDSAEEKIQSSVEASTDSPHILNETEIAYPVEGGNLYFDKATGTITDCDEDVTSADIPDEINGVPVTAIGSYAFSSCNSLSSVDIPVSVTSIKAWAFYDCNGLTSVNIPGSVTSIGDSAFYYCDRLTSVTIGDGVTTIGDEAFYYCDRLTSVDIPVSVTSIGDKAFMYCDKLTSVDIPDGVTSIGAHAFRFCRGLTSVTIGNSVASIGDFAFSNCDSLISVAIPDSVTSIGEYVFFACDRLTSVVIGSGVLSIEFRTFMYCDQLTSVDIPDSVITIGEDAFYDCGSLTSVTMDNSVTFIAEGAFDSCGSLTDVYYSGSKEEWDAISIGYRNEYLTSATIHYNSTGSADGGTESGEVDSCINGEFNYLSYNNQIATYTYTYKDSWFFESSYTYQHDLVKMSLRTAMAAFDTVDVTGEHSTNIETLMGEIGFQNAFTHYDERHTDSIGYAIANKELISDNGEKSSLILVAVRGAGYGAEWGGNLRLGDPYSQTRNHQGFVNAAAQVKSGLYNYINNHSETLHEELKVWIVGYSRAAATSNLVAADLTRFGLNALNEYQDGEINISNTAFLNKFLLTPENIFAFCFECPQTTVNTDANSKEFSNIVNIVNPIDFVTKVAMSKLGYRRYGNTLTLPTQESSEKYFELRQVMIESYESILRYKNNNKFVPDGIDFSDLYYVEDGQAVILDEFMDNLSYSVRNTKYYVNQYQDTLILAAAQKLGGANVDVSYTPLIPLGLDMLKYPVNTVKTLSLFINFDDIYIQNPAMYKPDNLFEDIFKKFSITGPAACAHYPELCLAWLDSMDDNTIISLNSMYRKIFINCPVDVEVIGSNGEVVARIVDDVVENIEYGVVAYLDDQGQKVLILPADGKYNVILNATDNGAITYTVAEYQTNDGTIDRVVSYFNVPITEGDVLIGNVEASAYESCAYALSLQDKQLIPNIDQKHNGVQEYEITVNVTGNGTASGEGIYLVGEYAKICATPTANTEFIGWYENDILISEDLEYRFLVDNNRALVAKFENSSASKPEISVENITLDASNIELNRSTSTYQLTAAITPRNATNQAVAWISSNPSVATVTDAGLVTAVSNGVTTITATTQDGGYTATCKVMISLSEESKVPVTGVELNAQKIELNRVGDVYQIEADVTPINATNQAVTWKSGNPGVVTVTDAGLVTAVSNGVTTITATTQDGGYTATCEVLVEFTENPNVPVTGVELNTQRITLSRIGNTYQLEANVTPINATNQAITWASSNPNMATVTDTGLVTAVSEGTATITVTTEDGQKVATCTVTVRIESSSGGTGGGGSSGSTTPASYTITSEYTVGGAITISPKTASKGQTVTITAVPNDGFALKTLSVTDKNGNKIELTKQTETSYTFKMPASKVTVSATFTEIVVEPEPIILPFDDISQSAWYYGAVEYVYSNDMMQGTSATRFSPEVEMSRGMIATVLYRLENTPALTGSTSFSDVGGNEWYTDAIQWAAENNIMSGYGNNRFGPMDSVTREQLAVILYNYTASNDISVEAAGDLSVFHDAEDTSDWAEKAISWAVGVGLLSGKGNGILDPAGTATRAEVAQILMNYCTKVVLVSKT